MPAIIRPRNQDGTLGDPVKIGKGETDAEKVVRLEAENATLKAKQIATEQIVNDNGLMQQELIELLIDMGVL
ncbi:hypothetical protein [Solibacillus isronensis]|uniref:hypothetical protein n=1 Tax=Solibacillus isronensis TaxID=412383 RepID=UPI0039A014F2